MSTNYVCTDSTILTRLFCIMVVIADIRLSHDKAASVVAKIADFPFAKVVDLYPGTDAEDMVAIGLGNGKVVLTSFGPGIINREFGITNLSNW